MDPIYNNHCLYIGTFNAEKYWRDSNLAVLPSIIDSNSNNIISSLDELQFVFCENDCDILFTRYKLENVQFDYLNEIGFNFRNEFIYNNEDEVSKSTINICALLTGSLKKTYLNSLYSEIQFRPYAVDEFCLPFCREYNLKFEIPNCEVVKKVNSKFYSYELLRNIYPEYNGIIIDSADSLIITGKKFLDNTGPFVIKDGFGVSGKGNLLIESENILQSLYRYLIKQENAGKEVKFIIEPFYIKDKDFSCHLEILPNGEIKNLSVQVMKNKGFSFAGIQEADISFYEYLHKINYYNYVDQIAKEIYSVGYFGPVCLDSMKLKDNSILPLLEINARKSMGFINTFFKKKCLDGVETFLIIYSLRIPNAVTYEKFLIELKSTNVLYFPGKRNGIIPLTSKAFNIDNNNTHNSFYRGKLYVEYIFENCEKKANLMKSLEKVFSHLHIQCFT